MFKTPHSTPSRTEKSNDLFHRLFSPGYSLAQAFLPGADRLLREQTSHHKNTQIFLQRSTDENERYVKGLKQLSKKVKDVVQNSEPLTYRDVANQLIVDSEPYLVTLDKIERDKEEKNIKRRVYDALNVLIASRVLTKQGKKVRGSASEKTIATMHFSQKISEMNRIYEEKERQVKELQKLADRIKMLFKTHEQQPRDLSRTIQGPVRAIVVDQRHILSLQPKTLRLQCSEPLIQLDQIEVMRRLL